VINGNPHKRSPHFFRPAWRNPGYCEWCFMKEGASVHLGARIREQEVYEKGVPEFKEGTRPEVDHLFKQLDESHIDDSTFSVGFICGLLVGGMVAATIWAIVLTLTG